MGLNTGEDYNQTLDEMFLFNSNNDILFELECCSSDRDATLDTLQRFWIYECDTFSVKTFGTCLLEDLKTIYFSNIFPIENFAKMCYSLWHHLPSELKTIEPFHTLSYADDPLSWDDEAQTRKIYEELFEFYI